MTTVSDPRSTLAIEASGLVKVFGETRAVDGVDLAVRTGSVYGVLGPNGAGKTTTIRMFATLLHPSRPDRLSDCWTRDSTVRRNTDLQETIYKEERDARYART